MLSYVKCLLKMIGWPLTVGTSWLPHGAPAVRYFMYERLSRVINDPEKGVSKRVLSISYSKGLVARMGLERAEIVEANYPEHSAADLSWFESEQFDYVISDQVLEHVEGNPQDVFDESRRLLKPGGIAVHTTVFVFPIHGYPSDFWRFTPACLEMLGRKFSEVIEVGGFGNRAMWIIDLLGLTNCPVPHAKWHPIHFIATKNVREWPIVTWIVVKK